MSRQILVPSVQGMLRLWSVYGVSSILSRSIAFLLLPLYTRVLSPEEYGVRAVVALALEMTLLLVTCGLKEAINRFYAGGPAPSAVRPEAASTGLLTHAGHVGVGAVAGILLAPWLAGPLLGDPGLAVYLRLGFVAVFFMHLQEGAFVYLRARGRARTVAFASLGNLLAMVALNLLFVVAFRWGVAGLFYTEILVFGVSGMAFTVGALRETGVRYLPGLAREMVRFGAPLMFMPFTWLALTRVDVMFLTHYGSLAYVGVYVLGVQCAQVLQLAVIYPFRYFWDFTQFQLGRDPGSGPLFRRMFQWFTCMTVVAAFGCAVASDDVIRVMAAPPFHGATAVVPILLVAYVLEAIHMFFNAALLVRNRTSLVAGVAGLTVAVNLGANALLVPPFLAVGAAAARVVAMVVMVGTTFVLAQRLWPQRPDFRGLAKVGGCAVALFAVSRALPELPLLVLIPVKGLLVLALVAFAIWSRALDRDDVRNAWSLVSDRLRQRFVGLRARDELRRAER